MKALTKCVLLMAILCLSACSVEKENGDPSKGGNGRNEASEIRQEVLLTFKNKLAITRAATKAADTPAASVAENAITSLDVYVFASASETGNYTFQERLAYRENEDELPSGSKELTLEAGNKENEFTSLLKLQKGLFVKLYCIANQPLLVDPADEGNVITDTYFQPLVQTTPGQASSKVATEGIPSESLFQSFHTPFIASAGDTLVCPLPMSGAYTQPLDLTDYSVSSRMQVGFKLTRTVARFDIINNAALSRFTIDSVGMANGRKAVTFFPIQAYGDQPTAQPDELITYPLRAFSGDKANTGTQTGAFYAYPSLATDETSLILKGRYKINETETKETSYPVAFKQTDAQGNGSFIEINPNHRYTVAITQADEYKLQTNIIASDWADDGSIDEYNPGESIGEIAVNIPDGFKDKSQWDAATRTVNMSLEAGSSAGVSVSTNSAILVSKRYSGQDQSYDWLEVSAPTVAATKSFAAFGYQYTLSLKDGYAKARYPKATLRFTDAATGKESIVIIEAVASPELIEIPKVPGDTNLNSLDMDTQTASIFRTTGSSLQIKFFCPNGVDMESAPSWLKVEKTKEEGTETTFTLTLLDRDVADTEGTVVFHNNKKPDDLKMDLTVQLQDASLTPAFNSLGGDGNVFTAAHDGVLDAIQMPVKEGNTFTIGVTSILGVEVAIDFAGGAEWLTHNGEVYTPTVSAAAPVNVSMVPAPVNLNASIQASGNRSVNFYAGNEKNTLTFSLDNNKLSGGKTATVTLKNKAGGKDYLFTVTPVWLAPANASGQLTSFNVNAGAFTEIRISTPCPPGGVSVSSASSGIADYHSFDSSTGIVTLKGVAAGSTSIKVYNSQDANKYISYNITVKTIPTSSYITITNGGMTRKWAVGNLVAQGSNSCAIGSAADKGLLFRWGSLVGYDATTSGNPAFPVVKPNAYSSSPSFTGSPYNNVGTPVPASGTGDPCRYYLGGSWRLPTADEYRNNLGGGVGTATFKVWEWVTSPAKGVKTGPSKQLFFPAAGFRNNSSGGLENAGLSGYVWSSTPNGSSIAFYLYFNSGNAFVSNYKDGRTYGFSVRCVQE